MEELRIILLEYTSGGSNKFYELSLVYNNSGRDAAYNVIARWGTRKKNKWNEEIWKTFKKVGTTKTLKTTTTRKAANRHFREILKSKRDKGYIVVKTKMKEPKPEPKDEGLERFSLMADDL